MNATTAVYRDALQGARLRHADLIASAGHERRLARASAVLTMRTGRIWAGIVGLAGFSLMVLAAGSEILGLRLDRAAPTNVLLLTWPAVAAAYVVGLALGSSRARSLAARPRNLDVFTELAWLSEANPAAIVRDLAAQLETAAIALPMAAFALLAPLNLHYMIFLVCFEGASPGGAERFAWWIRASLCLVGLAHLVLAGMCVRFAMKVRHMDTFSVKAGARRAQWSAYGVTVLASLVPGIVCVLPPFITALTGLAVNPLLFWFMTRRLVSERRALA